MRRFLSHSLLALALLLGAAGAAPAAHAALSCSYPSCSTNSDCNQQDGETCSGATSAACGSCQQTSTPTAASTGITPLTTQQYQDAAAARTKTDLPPNPDKGEAMTGVMAWIMSLFAWLVGVAAVTLDNAVFYTVIKMGDYVNSLSAVGITWRVLRDIGNIMLIFGFLSVGITTILNVNWYGVSTKMLPMMFVAAVFLNFSLFLSEAMVDTGNLFATQFYTQINGGDLAGSKSYSNIASEGISNKIMGQLGLQAVYGKAIDPDRAKDLLKANNSWIIGFMGIILFIVTAFVLFSLAFILIARFVALIFLIIASPLGFAALAMPGFANIQKKWWTSIFEQTITAPILLLMLYIALAVITDEKFLSFGPKPDWTGFIEGNLTGFASTMLSFLVAMGLLLAVVVYAKRWSAFGGDWATKMGAKLSFGATAWAGRNTVGLGSNFLAKQARKRGLSRIPILGTNLTKAFEYGAKSSFDVRGTGVLKNIPFGSQIAAGEAQKGGYKEDLKQRVEARTKYAAELKGKEFKDLSAEQQLEIIRKDNEITRIKKQITDEGKAGTLTAERLKDLNQKVREAENELDTLHEKAGTERGGKLTYGRWLGNLAIPYVGLPAANVEAAKKIKEEARKTKDDKELDALRKALKKAGGGEEEGGAPSAPGGGGAPSGGAPSGGAPSGAPPGAP